MRIEGLSQIKEQWYDRSPVLVAEYALARIAPHSNTIRATHTVSSGKLLIISSIEMGITRATAAGTPGSAQFFLRYVPAGGSSTILQAIEWFSNTLDVNRTAHIGQGLIFEEGDKLDLTTSDGSTGGTIEYWGHIMGMEFTV